MVDAAPDGKGHGVIEFRSIEDILKFAIQKEEASYFFYTDMAESAGDELTGRIFADIAQEELRHRGQLQLELMKMGRVVNADEDWAERSAADYVLEEGLPQDFTGADALRVAITKEHAAYRLYIDLLRMVQSPEAVETFAALADEEIRHKLKFEQAYENYTRQY